VSELDVSDAELLRRIVEGDQRAFEMLYGRYGDSLYGFALSYVNDATVASDVVQDVFIAVWRRRDTLVSHESLRALLFQITRNTALNTLRGSRRRGQAEQVAAQEDEIGGTPATPFDEIIEGREDRQRVVQAVLTLPERIREAVVLRWAHGLTYGEIAQAMNVSPETVKTQLARGLDLLRKKI
jgi:RNA polymerase sigma-70 factor (ECF subfamily)